VFKFLTYSERHKACLNPVPKEGSVSSRTGKPYDLVPSVGGMPLVCQQAKGHGGDCATRVPAHIQHDDGRKTPLKAYFQWPSKDSATDKVDVDGLALVPQSKA
jgi:hypothetical protein